MTIQRTEPGEGQESVWDYPRPPRVEPVARRVRIVFGGETIADTTRALRLLETSHPPTYYIPLGDIAPGALVPERRRSFCEFKGSAHYYSVRSDGLEAPDAAWGYASPTPQYRALKDHVAFYAGPMDGCFVGDERVEPQPGGFYGGWITRDVVVPFKGAPGTMGW